eukprot:scaffold1877_cov67-Phaeocystis_antarctica.AAC.2
MRLQQKRSSRLRAAPAAMPIRSRTRRARAQCSSIPAQGAALQRRRCGTRRAGCAWWRRSRCALRGSSRPALATSPRRRHASRAGGHLPTSPRAAYPPDPQIAPVCRTPPPTKRVRPAPAPGACSPRRPPTAHCVCCPSPCPSANSFRWPGDGARQSPRATNAQVMGPRRPPSAPQ